MQNENLRPFVQKNRKKSDTKKYIKIFKNIFYLKKAIEFMRAWVLTCFSHVWLYVALWNVIYQALLSIGFSREEYWTGLPCPSPRDLSHPGTEPMHLTSPALEGRFFIPGSWKKQESSRKTSISALLTMPKPLTMWITINCGKFWKRWEYQTTWLASWEICMQIRKQQLELDMEQQTSSK